MRSEREKERLRCLESGTAVVSYSVIEYQSQDKSALHEAESGDRIARRGHSNISAGRKRGDRKGVRLSAGRFSAGDRVDLDTRSTFAVKTVGADTDSSSLLDFTDAACEELGQF